MPWDELDGRVFIALPKRRTRIERALERVVPTPHNTLMTFEGESARFWTLADGTRTLDDLAAALEATPARVERFTARLAHRGLLTLHAQPSAAPDTRKGLGEAQGFRRHTCWSCALTHPLRASGRAVFFCPRCKRPNRLARGNTGPSGSGDESPPAN